MAIGFVSVGTPYSNAGNVVRAPGAPAGSSANDLWLVATWDVSSTGTFPDASSGYSTLLFDQSANGTLKIEYKIVAGGEAAPTFAQITGVVSGQNPVICQIAAISGVDTTNPIDVTGTVFTSASTSNIGPITGINPTPADFGVVVVGGRGDDWTSVALLTGDSLAWTEMGEPDTTSGTDAGLVWDLGVRTGAAAAVTAKTFTVTLGGPAVAKGVMFSLKPVAAATFTARPEQVFYQQAVGRASTW